MPRISAFYGIVIWMYHDEIHHLGRPHFHATYGRDEASVDLESLAVLAGELPPRALRLVVDWASEHQAEPARQLGSRTAARCAATDRASSVTGVPSEAMRSTPLLVAATPLEGHTVHVRFEDGTAADVDLGYLLDYGGVFEPLRDPAYFRELRADAGAGTIVWPNDADIAPETLYAKARERAVAST